MACCTPPARGEQARPSGCFNVLEMCDPWIAGVCAEAVLLVVACAEDVVPKTLHAEDEREVRWSQHDWVNGEVLGLETVREWHPDEVAKCEHEAEAVGCDVHGRENRRLAPDGIKDIDELGEIHQDLMFVSSVEQ